MELKKTSLLFVAMYMTRWLVPPSVAKLPSEEDKRPQYLWQSRVSNVPDFSHRGQYLKNDKCISKDACYQKREYLNRNNETWIMDRSPQVRLKAVKKEEKAASLRKLLLTIIQKELSNCHLALVYDISDLNSVVVQDLLMQLSNTRQVGVF